MAVIQISKIQVRRGQKLTGVGVPQLSSAEFAWAVDTQELFIGNGSVAEGAPEVGNTKILTEHDNILELISGYRFGLELNVINSVERSLQNKLDEYVSVTDYGAIGDGETNNLQFFQAALDELFANPLKKTLKKVLIVPNGTYIISGNLKIPSTAIINGETKDQSIIDIAGNNIVFVSENKTEVSNFTSSDKPIDIKISNLTIKRTNGQIDITGVSDSIFENINFIGNYSFNDTVTTIDNEPAVITWENTIAGTKVNDIIFKDCLFKHTSLPIKSRQTIVDITNPPTYDTRIEFLSCKFFVCHTGIFINGIEEQGNRWVIDSCMFEEIYARAFESTNGIGTIIQHSRFIKCGNENNINEPKTSIVFFGQKKNNVVINCYSDRHQNNNFTNFETTAAITEIENASRAFLNDQNYSEIFLSDSFRPLSVFSALNRYIYIDYNLMLGQYSRVGTLILTIDREFENVSLTDSFSYSPQFVSSPGGIRMTSFEFSATLRSNNTDDDSSQQVIDTVLLLYKNPLTTGESGSISYSISYGV